MATLTQGIKKAKDERLQVHWNAPGLAAIVYNVKGGTTYQIVKDRGEWSCNCIFARQYARNGAICKHAAATIKKEIREGLVEEGRSPEQAAAILEHYSGMMED